MIDPPARRIDERRLMRTVLHWEVDSENFAWLEAVCRDGTKVRMRINMAFPDGPLYSLLVDVDETFDFDDLPRRWTRTNDLRWPTNGPGL